jgi:hypothetical protein
MIIVGDAILSEDILDKRFVCQLDQCKGACCIEGDAGAPLLHAELEIIENVLPTVKKYMRSDALEYLAEKGFHTRDPDGELVTECQKSGECVFVQYDGSGIAKCSFEMAYEAGESAFKKPISCHLYPIRAKRYGNYTALNYHKWDICNPACKAGSEMNVRVFEFLKEPLIRKMGADWYKELEEVSKAWEESKGEDSEN